MVQNFDTRRRLFGDLLLGEVNLRMIQCARSVGGERAVSAKLLPLKQRKSVAELEGNRLQRSPGFLTRKESSLQVVQMRQRARIWIFQSYKLDPALWFGLL